MTLSVSARSLLCCCESLRGALEDGGAGGKDWHTGTPRSQLNIAKNVHQAQETLGDVRSHGPKTLSNIPKAVHWAPP